MIEIIDKRHLHDYYIQIVSSDAIVYKKINDWYILVHHPISEAFVGNLYYWSEIKDKVIPVKPTKSFYTSSYTKTLGEIEIFEIVDYSKFEKQYKVNSNFSILNTEELIFIVDVNGYSSDDFFCIVGNRDDKKYISTNNRNFEVLDQKWENEFFDVLKYIHSKIVI